MRPSRRRTCCATRCSPSGCPGGASNSPSCSTPTCRRGSELTLPGPPPRRLRGRPAARRGAVATAATARLPRRRQLSAPRELTPHAQDRRSPRLARLVPADPEGRLVRSRTPEEARCGSAPALTLPDASGWARTRGAGAGPPAHPAGDPRNRRPAPAGWTTCRPAPNPLAGAGRRWGSAGPGPRTGRVPRIRPAEPGSVPAGPGAAAPPGSRRPR